MILKSMRVLLVAALLTTAVYADDQATSTVTVYLSGVRSSSGVIRAAMCAETQPFPGCPHTLIQPAKAGVMKLVFKVKPGTYAFYGFHDENNNGKMDMDNGFPLEGFAFGNDAVGKSGPPNFKASSIQVDGNAVTKVKMMYIQRPVS